jgi:Na+-translocating ferredoxin:NAD+ oxidoreductase RnfD subunit
LLGLSRSFFHIQTAGLRCFSVREGAYPLHLVAWSAFLGRMRGPGYRSYYRKNDWEGTGKNPLNTAMLGFAFLTILTPSSSLPLSVLLSAAAVLLSLPFLYIRPYAAGHDHRMLVSLFTDKNLTAVSLLSTGVFFWCCIVITDPVTTTLKTSAGFVIGLLAGFLPGLTGSSAAAMPIGILVSNLLYIWLTGSTSAPTKG